MNHLGVFQEKKSPHITSILNSISPLTKNSLAFVLPLFAAAALLAVADRAAAADFWDGNLSTTWDTTTQNWKTLASGGTSTAFTTGGNVTFGITSPT
ncbi:MAG: hypothetical protein WCI20_09935, partial [bacterium]